MAQHCCRSSHLLSTVTLIILCCLTNVVNAATTHKQPTYSFPAILVFGDSTVDTGNNNHFLTIFRSNHLPYGQDFPGSIPTGRFSNGRLTIDMLASALKIKDFVPPFLDPSLSPRDLISGVSFASGGCGFDNTTDSAVSIPVDVQLHQFQDYIARLNEIVGSDDDARRILGEALVVISAGTNDVALNYYDNPTRSAEYTIAEYQDFLQGKMHNVVKGLYKMGCRKMLIVGLPPIGCLPIQMTIHLDNTECVKEQNDDTRVYNKKLIRQISKMQKQFPGIKLSYADIYSPLLDMIKHPSKYGFEVTNAGCCGTGLVEAGPLCNVLSIACADSTKYVFWDAIHPTEAAYYYIAQSILRHSLSQLR
ncbi:hypothetical protein QQ045_017564 [Rhodiola kirilowii]